MGKTFAEQLKPILEERFRNCPLDVNRYLKKACTPAAQTLIKYIRQWDFQSRDHALSELIERERWNHKGEFFLERDIEGKDYPVSQVPLEMAWERYVFGDQQYQVMPHYSFADAIKNMPTKFKTDWKHEIQGLFFNINRRNLKEFKLIALGKAVKSLGASNPHTISNWDRNVTDFNNAQQAINAYVVKVKGWEYMTTKNLQNPKHAKKMAKELGDILAKADEAKEPAYKALQEQERKMYARSDATRARNWIKNLKGHFQRYSEPEPNALGLLNEIIGDIEIRTLSPV